jgi:hypothetical protein
MIEQGLSPYALEILKLASQASEEAAARFVKSRTPKTRAGRRPITVVNLIKKSNAKRMAIGVGSGSLGTLVLQSAGRDWSTGRKYRKAVERQRKEQERQQKALENQRGAGYR